MKKVLVFTFLIATNCNLQSQTKVVTYDSIKKEVLHIVTDRLDSANYTRIPNKDLDKQLNQQVDTVVNSKFQFIYWIVGVLAFVLGGSTIFIVRNYLNEKAKESIAEAVKIEVDKINNQLLASTIEIKKNMEEKLKDVSEKIDHADVKLMETKKEMLSIRLERIEQNVNTDNVAYETFNSLKSSLKESESLIDSDLISKVINILSKASYLLGKETEMDKIVQKHMNDEDLKLSSNVFLNLAAGFFYLFSSTLDPSDKQKCVYYINETLRRFLDYGEAYALKTEILMDDYLRSQDDLQKQNLEQDIKQILNRAGNKLTATEFIQRFTRIKEWKKDSLEGNLIVLIEKKFQLEMENLKKIAEQKPDSQ